MFLTAFTTPKIRIVHIKANKQIEKPQQTKQLNLKFTDITTICKNIIRKIQCPSAMANGIPLIV